jgi:4-amino-4-deoxy-L-arabinose transferase-like glycosyltransferase
MYLWQRQGVIPVSIVFMVCLVLRLTVAFTIDMFVPVNKSVDLYTQLAINLLHGHGFVIAPGGEPVLWRAPIYPAFLAALFALVGEGNILGTLVAQSALDAVSATLVWWMGRQLFSDSSGLIAGLAFALHPLSAYYSLRFLPESLFTLCITAVAASIVWASQSRCLTPFFIVGMASAIAALVKPGALLLGLPLCVALLWRQDLDWRSWLHSSIMILLGTVITVLPWTLRNYVVTETIVPVATGGGYALWLGNHRTSRGMEDWELDEKARMVLHKERQAIQAAAEPVSRNARDEHTSPAYNEPRRDDHNISLQLDRAFIKAALDEFIADPVGSGSLLVQKFFRFWFSVFLPENKWAQWYISAFQTLFLGLSLAGIIACRGDWDRIVPLLLPIVYLTVLHTLTFATLRYSIPTVPILALLAVVGASHLKRVMVPHMATLLQNMPMKVNRHGGTAKTP